MLYTHLLNLAAHYTCLNCCAKVHLKRFVSSSSKAELNLLQRQMNKCSISNLTVRCRLWAHGLFFAEHWNTFAGNSVGCAKHLCTLALGRPLGVAVLCKLQHEGLCRASQPGLLSVLASKRVNKRWIPHLWDMDVEGWGKEWSPCTEQVVGALLFARAVSSITSRCEGHGYSAHPLLNDSRPSK